MSTNTVLHWRRIDAYEGGDQLSLVFYPGVVTQAHVVDEEGTSVARASYSVDDLHPNTVLLTHLVVNKVHQGQGIGSKLLRCLYREKWLGQEVRICNAARKAIGFYNKLGFETCGVGDLIFRQAAQTAEGATWPSMEAKRIARRIRSNGSARSTDVRVD
jgi:ribosomal protein S18 acetylase RimI-like enzyme